MFVAVVMFFALCMAATPLPYPLPYPGKSSGSWDQLEQC